MDLRRLEKPLAQIARMFLRIRAVLMFLKINHLLADPFAQKQSIAERLRAGCPPAPFPERRDSAPDRIDHMTA